MSLHNLFNKKQNIKQNDADVIGSKESFAKKIPKFDSSKIGIIVFFAYFVFSFIYYNPQYNIVDCKLDSMTRKTSYLIDWAIGNRQVDKINKSRKIEEYYTQAFYDASQKKGLSAFIKQTNGHSVDNFGNVQYINGENEDRQPKDAYGEMWSGQIVPAVAAICDNNIVQKTTNCVLYHRNETVHINRDYGDYYEAIAPSGISGMIVKKAVKLNPAPLYADPIPKVSDITTEEDIEKFQKIMNMVAVSHFNPLKPKAAAMHYAKGYLEAQQNGKGALYVKEKTKKPDEGYENVLFKYMQSVGMPSYIHFSKDKQKFITSATSTCVCYSVVNPDFKTICDIFRKGTPGEILDTRSDYNIVYMANGRIGVVPTEAIH